MSERYLRSIRLLVECVQQVENLSDPYIRQFDLTQAQFDIIATLGNTQGFSCKELGEKTLITKGTLTGVLDRLQSKHLIERVQCKEDRRLHYIRLTKKGEKLFEEAFPYVIQNMKARFKGFTKDDFAALEEQLIRLREAISD